MDPMIKRESQVPALQGDVQRCPAVARGHLLRPYPTSDLARVLACRNSRKVACGAVVMVVVVVVVVAALGVVMVELSARFKCNYCLEVRLSFLRGSLSS